MTAPFSGEPLDPRRWFGDVPPPPPTGEDVATPEGTVYAAQLVIEATDAASGNVAYRKSFYSDPAHLDEAEAVRQLLSRCLIIEDES